MRISDWSSDVCSSDLVLLRARAIEAGCFVIAAAQTGRHEDGRETYGHSCAVDPWGDILLDMGAVMGLALTVIELERLPDVRSRVPPLANRRSRATEVRSEERRSGE